ncbi:MAG: hypothetical protein ACPGSB_01495 [Opitutales bacterium]
MAGHHWAKPNKPFGEAGKRDESQSGGRVRRKERSDWRWDAAGGRAAMKSSFTNPSLRQGKPPTYQYEYLNFELFRLTCFCFLGYFKIYDTIQTMHRPAPGFREADRGL